MSYHQRVLMLKGKTRPVDTFSSGGEGGIRTLGGPEPTTVFETVPFNHSGTSPGGVTCQIDSETSHEINSGEIIT